MMTHDVMAIDELSLAQADGSLPTTLAAGSAPGESGVCVHSVRFPRRPAPERNTAPAACLLSIGAGALRLPHGGRALRHPPRRGRGSRKSYPQRAKIST
jgi:hypothetical protein